MKRFLSLLLVLIMCVGLFAACGSTTTETATETETAESEATAEETEEAPAGEPIVIGCLQDITGPTSSLGVAVTEGAQWAIDAINADGGIDGRQVELKVYDTTGSVDEAITAFTRACTEDGVTAVIGPPVANMGLAIAPISENYDVPFLCFAMDKNIFVKEDGSTYKNMFLFQPNADQQAAIMASYAINELGLTDFGIIYNEQNAYSTSLVDGFEVTVAENSANVVGKEAYNPDNKDFNTLLTKIMTSNPEAIFTPNYTADLALIVQAAAEVGYEGKIIAGLDACPPFNTIVENVEDLSNIVFINNVDDTEETLTAMIQEVKDAKGVDATNKFFLGYDVANILDQVISEVGDDPVAVRDAVEMLEGYEGLTGTITINPETHMTEGLEMYTFTYDVKTPVAQKKYSA